MAADYRKRIGLSGACGPSDEGFEQADEVGDLVSGVVVHHSDADGALLGAVGVSGDTSDNDEASAMTGIASVGLTGDPGTD
jgi:hypothetical protein